MKIVISAICGALSVLLAFIAIPLLFSVSPFLGFPDSMWMVLRVLMPVVAAVILFRRSRQVPSGYIWVGLPAQYLALFLLAERISGILGMSLGGLGGFAYLFEAAVWPFVVTLAQFFVLFLLEKFENKNKNTKPK